jgi:serine/threonine protein kinase/tetratricopeptide (TPR) repeat protein
MPGHGSMKNCDRTETLPTIEGHFSDFYQLAVGRYTAEFRIVYDAPQTGDEDMNVTQYEEDIFIAALEIESPQERADYLDDACGENAQLRSRVEALLNRHQESSGMLDAPPPGIDATEYLEVISEKPGAVIGTYKLREEIGVGGFGVVFLAEQERPVKRKVALKIIKPGMDTRQVIARFEAERQALAMMDHPNIARVFDAGSTASGRPYFVMELVHGVPITEYCDQCQLTTRERLELFVTVCQAAQHAHQKGVIHRDLKPSNVLVAMQDGQPAPKIIDFGVSKAIGQRLTEHTLVTGFAQMIGTPLYMSPEQAELSPLGVDTRSDIYSLGVLLYELLTGTTPFDKDRLHAAPYDELRRIIREEEPPRPSSRISTLAADLATTVAEQRRSEPRRLRQTIRGDLDWIVMKCLDKDRNRRYETVSALATDIQRYLNDEPIEARSPSVVYCFRKFARRNGALLAAGGAVAIALIIGLGLSTFLFFRERSAVQLAKANEQRAISEATKSKTVAQFMTDMLKGVGPSLALGRDTSMLREILDQTAARLHELTDQPLVQADLRATLGNVYSDLGDYTRAEAMHREALALRRQLLGGEHPDVATALNDLAEVHYQQSKYREAEALSRDSLALRQMAFGESHPAIAQSCDNLAEALRKQGKYSEAEPLFRQALMIRLKLFGNDHLDVAQSLSNLGRLFWSQGKYSEAESMHRKELAMRRSMLGNEHPDVANSLDRLGLTLDKQGRYEEAEAVYREELASQKNVLGNEHPYIANTLHNLGKTLSNRGKLQEAEAVLRQGLAMRRKLLGHENLHVVSSLKELTKTLLTQKKLDELDALYRKRLAIQRKMLGNEHADVVTSLHELGSLLKEQGKLNEAEHLFREALALRRELPVNADPSLDDALTLLAQSLVKQRKHAEAEPLFREALAIRRKTIGNENPRLAISLCDLASVLDVQGKWREAEPLYREIMALLRDHKLQAPKLSPHKTNILAWMFATHPDADQRDSELAIVLARQAVELAPQDANIWNTLGVAHYRANDWKSAIESLEKSEGLSNGDNSFNFFFLAMAHWQLGYKEEARKWYNKAVEWMDKNLPEDKELLGFRAEAAELLGLITAENERLAADREPSQSTNDKE